MFEFLFSFAKSRPIFVYERYLKGGEDIVDEKILSPTFVTNFCRQHTAYNKVQFFFFTNGFSLLGIPLKSLKRNSYYMISYFAKHTS